VLRIVLGLTTLVAVGAGGYYLGARRPDATVPPPQALAELPPLEVDHRARQPETLDPVMLKMIESHFKEQADWKAGQ
jgi:hypothetical protein